MYDFLIVGAGLFGSVFAYEATKAGNHCLVIDKRPHVGGNIYTYEQDKIIVHAYGAHIFHTGDKEVARFIQQFAAFNRFTNSPIAIWKGRLYHLPFNMNTFHELWGVKFPEEARKIIDEQKKPYQKTNPRNLEEYALSQVGKDIYERLIKGYTEKQWGCPATRLPPSIIKRIPLRFTYDNNYYSDSFQGIPIGGYTPIIEQLLSNSEIKLCQPFHPDLMALAKTTLFTGPIDEFYGYRFGTLGYRGLRFEIKEFDEQNIQGNAVLNYTEKEIPYTRTIEHKHFDFGNQEKTIITYEYPSPWNIGEEPYYPINSEENIKLYAKYKGIPSANVIFGGRLGSYKYYDMQDTIKAALLLARTTL